MMSMPMEIITDDANLTSAGFHWREKDGVLALVCGPLEQDGFTNAFSTRRGGASPMPRDALNLAGFDADAAENIYENRRRFLRLLGGEWTLATCWQEHGREVRVVANPQAALSDRARCDALITDRAGILLGIKTADCVPILLGDARTGVVAAIHAGWRGTLATLALETLHRLREEYGVRAQDVRACMGPAARACCYEVGPEVIDAFRAQFAYAAGLFTPTRPDHARIDLHHANREQLIEAGVAPDRIHIAPLCTICRNDLFFSYRHEKNLYGHVGRLLSVIGKTVRQ
jgi:YfiH family protein